MKKKNKGLRLAACFWISLIATWIILTLGLLVKAGPERLGQLFTGENLQLTIAVYVIVGLVCGSTLGGLLFFIVRGLKKDDGVKAKERQTYR